MMSFIVIQIWNIGQTDKQMLHRLLSFLDISIILG